MCSYKWGFKSLNMGYRYSCLLITLLITTHEPPSKPLHLQSPAAQEQLGAARLPELRREMEEPSSLLSGSPALLG